MHSVRAKFRPFLGGLGVLAVQPMSTAAALNSSEVEELVAAFAGENPTRIVRLIALSTVRLWLSWQELAASGDRRAQRAKKRYLASFRTLEQVRETARQLEGGSDDRHHSS